MKTLFEELKEKDKIPFPDGKIVTLDGRTLDCYLIEQDEVDEVDNKIRLDTTGTYLVFGKKPTPAPPVPIEAQNQIDLFFDNAFYLLAHKERIMSDSRMFLCPISVQNGLAYTGTSGFRRPTLGIYLEWWSLVPNAMHRDKQGKNTPFLPLFC